MWSDIGIHEVSQVFLTRQTPGPDTLGTRPAPQELGRAILTLDLYKCIFTVTGTVSDWLDSTSIASLYKILHFIQNALSIFFLSAKILDVEVFD